MIHLTDEEIEARAERAKQLFRDGFNCSQSVVAACADLYGIEDESLALRFAASFGGGIARMRMVCGAASGMFMLAGLENGSSTRHDPEGKMRNYAFVQQLAAEYKQQYGSLICADLLGIAREAQAPKPAARTDEYYLHRPCPEMIAQAVRIYLHAVSDAK